MSIKLDWEVTDAPAGDEAGPHKPGPALAELPRLAGDALPKPKPWAAWPRRRLVWLTALALLAAVSGVSAWLITRAGWQRITDDVKTLVRYEEDESLAGRTAIVLALQDPSNTDWLALRGDQAEKHQAAPLPVPMLAPGDTPLEVTSFAAVDGGVVATISRQFRTPDGQTLRFSLPQFYRRSASNDWLRSAPPGAFWGEWLTWQSQHLLIRYATPDADFVAQAGPALEARLAAACAAWTDVCASAPPSRLYLSGFVGAIGYDPLANIEVRIELSTLGQSEADNYLSVPSPQIAGIPADEAGARYLTDYLAVRLIASLASHAAHAAGQYEALTATAIAALHLSGADPGYVTAGSPVSGADVSFGGAPLLGMRVLPADEVQIYTVQPGDTLTDIASRFETEVATIARLNGIADPNQIAAGTALVIPAAPADKQ